VAEFWNVVPQLAQDEQGVESLFCQVESCRGKRVEQLAPGLCDRCSGERTNEHRLMRYRR